METIKPIEIKAKDNKTLPGFTWGDPTTAKAVIVLVHGLGEHVRRYDHIGEKVTERGIAMLGIDQRGFGKSASQPGVIGSSAALMSDITTVIAEARRLNPQAPIFLYGHSMGGTEVVYYALSEKPDLAGIIATSPSLSSDAMTKVQIMLVKLLGGLLPNLTVVNGLDAGLLSHNEAVVVKYLSDPLVHNKVSVALGKFMYEAALYAQNHAREWRLPLYLAHGSADAICPIEGSKTFFSNLSGDVTFKVWEGLYHETHNEPEKDEVIRTMLDWVEAHI